MAQQLFRHPETALTLEQTSKDSRFEMAFRKTYAYTGDYIDDRHQALADAKPSAVGMLDIGIDGWLLPAGALKLYEMAYFCGGDVLELGTYKGLSTSIMAGALDRVGAGCIVTVDLDPVLQEEAKANVSTRPGGERVHYFVFDGGEFVRRQSAADRRYEFVYVDHSHAYEHVLPVTQALHGCMKPGAFVLFDDYNDPRNPDIRNRDYGVYQAVTEGLGADFEFWGIYGAAALYRYIPA